jgi:hypothetical protein
MRFTILSFVGFALLPLAAHVASAGKRGFGAGA